MRDGRRTRRAWKTAKTGWKGSGQHGLGKKALHSRVTARMKSVRTSKETVKRELQRVVAKDSSHCVIWLILAEGLLKKQQD